MHGTLGAVLGILGGIATVLAYVAWSVTHIRRALRTLDRLAGEHQAMMDAAHRHNRATGQVVRVKWPRGDHRGR